MQSPYFILHLYPLKLLKKTITKKLLFCYLWKFFWYLNQVLSLFINLFFFLIFKTLSISTLSFLSSLITDYIFIVSSTITLGIITVLVYSTITVSKKIYFQFKILIILNQKEKILFCIFVLILPTIANQFIMAYSLKSIDELNLFVNGSITVENSTINVPVNIISLYF